VDTYHGRMLLLVTVLMIGVLFGFGLGGHPRALADVRIKWWGLIPIALILQLLPVPRGETGLSRLIPVGVLLLAYVVLITVALVNWRLRGFLLILLGLILNFTVIGMNHGMPVSEDAIRETGNVALLEEDPGARGAKHHLADDEDVLLPLADVIAFREPFGVVVSVGDLAIDAGGGVFLAAAMLGRPERSRRTPRVRGREARRIHPRPLPPTETSGTQR
jgi:hypothetical protein